MVSLTASLILASVCRAFLATLFATSGLKKVFSVRRFLQVVSSYDILPPPVVKPAAISLIFGEIVIAVVLTIGLCPRATAIFAAFLLSLFTIAMATNLIRGRKNLDCGCFGRTGTKIHWALVARNIVIIVVVCGTLLIAPTVTVSLLKFDLSAFCGLIAFLMFMLTTLLFDLSSMRSVRSISQ